MVKNSFRQHSEKQAQKNECNQTFYTENSEEAMASLENLPDSDNKSVLANTLKEQLNHIQNEVRS